MSVWLATKIEPLAIEVNPVPPFPKAKVPVILLAPKFTASSVLSITKPPFAFKSKLKVLPLLSNPFPGVICPAPLNWTNSILSVPTLTEPLLVTTKPLSPFVVPCSTKVNAPPDIPEEALKSLALVQLPEAHT